MSFTPSRAVLLVLLTGLFSFAGAGCSVVSSVRDRYTVETFEGKVAESEEALVFDATKTVLMAMGYVHERGNPSDHRMEMATRVQAGSAAQNKRQRRVFVKFSAMGTQGTDVSIGFWEISEEVETSGPTVAGARMIRGGTLYDAFWERLEKELQKRADEPATTAAAPTQG